MQQYTLLTQKSVHSPFPGTETVADTIISGPEVIFSVYTFIGPAAKDYVIDSVHFANKCI